MKSNLIIIESNLIILLYSQKSYPFIYFRKQISLKCYWIVIFIYFCSNDLTHSKGNKFNYVHYWN
jgi:hypothetical protein